MPLSKNKRKNGKAERAKQARGKGGAADNRYRYGNKPHGPLGGDIWANVFMGRQSGNDG